MKIWKRGTSRQIAKNTSNYISPHIEAPECQVTPIKCITTWSFQPIRLTSLHLNFLALLWLISRHLICHILYTLTPENLMFLQMYFRQYTCAHRVFGLPLSLNYNPLFILKIQNQPTLFLEMWYGSNLESTPLKKWSVILENGSWKHNQQICSTNKWHNPPQFKVHLELHMVI